MGRAHEVRAAAMAKTAAVKSKLYSRYGKEIYIAAKSGVPDPAMNLTLARKIKEAKSNQVPADVIKRSIERAKGGSDENYSEARYEGFGPGNSTFIVDCLTDNTNRTLTAVRDAFNHTKGAKIAAAGSVAFNYQRLGVFSFETDKSEDELIELMLMSEIDVVNLKVEDGYADIQVNPSDFAKAQDCLESNLPGIEFDRCESAMVPNEYVTLTDEKDITYYNKLMGLLNESEDVNKIYTNAILPQENED